MDKFFFIFTDVDGYSFISCNSENDVKKCLAKALVSVRGQTLARLHNHKCILNIYRFYNNDENCELYDYYADSYRKLIIELQNDYDILCACSLGFN